MRNGECGMDRASVEPTANPGDRTLPAIPQSAFRTPHSGVGWCGEAQAAAGPAPGLCGRRRGECAPREEEGIPDGGWYPPGGARRTISYDNARAVLEQATAMVQALAHVVDGAAPEQPA